MLKLHANIRESFISGFQTLFRLNLQCIHLLKAVWFFIFIRINTFKSTPNIGICVRFSLKRMVLLGVLMQFNEERVFLFRFHRYAVIDSSSGCKILVSQILWVNVFDT
jgi:hypothetical protein